MDVRNYTIIARLRDCYPNLSGIQQRIADYIGEHPDEVIFLTAAQLGERVGTSESSVVRFAQVIGFAGYPELRREMQLDFRGRANHMAMMASGSSAFAHETTLIAEIAQRDADLIRETAVHLDTSVMDRCVHRILAADRVFVTGHRASYAFADYFATTLLQSIGVGVALPFGTGLALDTIGSAKPNDVIIAISITPYAPPTISILTAAQTRGLYCIVITDNPLGEPAQLANDVITFETEIHAFTSSYVGVLTIFHTLLALIGQHAHQRAQEFLDKVEPLYAATAQRLSSSVRTSTTIPSHGPGKAENRVRLGSVRDDAM